MSEWTPDHPLANAPHEAFSQALAAGKTQAEAYRSAGYQADDSSVSASASRLLRNTKVRARVQYLQQEAAEAVIVNSAWVIRELKKNVEQARENGDLAAVNKALELLGKHIGMFKGV